MPIISEFRYFGPGLPDEGTTDPFVAFHEGLTYHQRSSLRRFLRDHPWTGGESVAIPELVVHIDEIKGVIDRAREEFLRDNASLATAMTILIPDDDSDATGDEPIEPPETPLDTPSLDTSFHDHEMDF